MALQVLYGGTFDPVHNGHLGVARHARDTLGAGIRLMPAADPPHKPGTRADARQRAEMLQLATEGEPGLCIDLRELQRDGPSYTVDTLRELRRQEGPDGAWAILIGADSFRSLHEWDRWRDLFALAHVVAARRPGSDLDQPLATGLAAEVESRRVCTPAELSRKPAGSIFFLEQPLFRESATEVRRRIRAAEPWRDMVPAAVAAYIAEHGLYA